MTQFQEQRCLLKKDEGHVIKHLLGSEPSPDLRKERQSFRRLSHPSGYPPFKPFYAN